MIHEIDVRRIIYGDPGRTRTCNPLLRRLLTIQLNQGHCLTVSGLFHDGFLRFTGKVRQVWGRV